jgi:hypothetical protein
MSRVIGIDPGTDTGVAIYNPATKSLEMCESTGFWGAIDLISANRDAMVIIELPNTSHVWHTGAVSQAAKNKTASNVGKVLREAELLIEFCKLNGISCRSIPPKGKVNAKVFKMVTGWKGMTNEHARDAGMLCFGVK